MDRSPTVTRPSGETGAGFLVITTSPDPLCFLAHWVAQSTRSRSMFASFHFRACECGTPSGRLGRERVPRSTLLQGQSLRIRLRPVE